MNRHELKISLKELRWRIEMRIIMLGQTHVNTKMKEYIQITSDTKAKQI